MHEPESLGQYHDLWAWTMLSAPDQFRDVLHGGLATDQTAALIDAFGRLRAGFPFAARKLKDGRLSRIAKELIEMSLESYLQGDKKTGAHTLGECEGLIWTGSRQRPKYVVEAERRAFGKNVLFANVVISPYPYEGTASDLTANQAKLLSLAQWWCRSFQQESNDFKYFSWVIDANDSVMRTSIEPSRDPHTVLKPVQRSSGHKRLKELARADAIKACVLMEIVAPQGDGIVVFDLEERGSPRVSARQLFERRHDGVHYEQMRYHLEEPTFFAGGSDV